jgi:hypothetical protein
MIKKVIRFIDRHEVPCWLTLYYAALLALLFNLT